MTRAEGLPCCEEGGFSVVRSHALGRRRERRRPCVRQVPQRPPALWVQLLSREPGWGPSCCTALGEEQDFPDTKAKEKSEENKVELTDWAQHGSRVSLLTESSPTSWPRSPRRVCAGTDPQERLSVGLFVGLVGTEGAGGTRAGEVRDRGDQISRGVAQGLRAPLPSRCHR